MIDETDETEERDLCSLVDEYIGVNRLRFEGDSGMENLNNVVEAMGYKGHGFRFGTSLEEFLSDNPGAQEAILDWIREQDIQEWKDNLESELPMPEGDDNE